MSDQPNTQTETQSCPNCAYNGIDADATNCPRCGLDFAARRAAEAEAASVAEAEAKAAQAIEAARIAQEEADAARIAAEQPAATVIEQP